LYPYEPPETPSRSVSKVSRRPLNDLIIRQLPHTGKQYAVWDATLPSFGLRIARCTKTFVLKKDNKYYCLGRWPSVSLKTARQEANRRLALRYFPQATPTVRLALVSTSNINKSGFVLAP